MAVFLGKQDSLTIRSRFKYPHQHFHHMPSGHPAAQVLSLFIQRLYKLIYKGIVCFVGRAVRIKPIQRGEG